MKKAIATAIALASSLNAMADFAGDFQAAKKLFNRRKYQEAEEAFKKLAPTSRNAHGKASSLSYAAIALGKRKKYDEAMELAKTIEVKPVAAYTQMAIMDTNRKRKDLIAASKDEDIAAWPDAINYKGFLLRGVAYAVVGDRQAALKDLNQCVSLAGCDNMVKLEALNRMAVAWRALKDDAKAMGAYKKAFAIYEDDPRWKGKWLYAQALLGAARILISQGKYDDAMAVLAKFSVKPSKEKRGPWDFLVLEAYGDVSAAQGKPDDALAKYQEAGAIKTHKTYIDRVNKKIEALRRK